MNETRACQNCKKDFEIEQEDFDFYKKVDVPAPTWCPDCRMVRRMMWQFDAVTLYARTCDAPGHNEKIFSNYSPECSMPVYDYVYWRSDAWDPRDYGRDYDFSKNFFEQFSELHNAVPIGNLEVINSVNCDYCPAASDCKNCYLSSGAFGSENCYYCHTIVMCKECVDADLSTLNEKVMRSFSVDQSFKTSHAAFSADLVNCDFMYDCVGSSDCFGGVNLRNKRYYIFNKLYSKTEYKEERAKYDLGSYKIVCDVKKRHQELVKSLPKKYALIKNAPACTGDNIWNAKNAKFVFQALDDIENAKYCFVLGKGTKDVMDVTGAGLKCQELYECGGVIRSQRVFFSQRVYDSLDVYYSRGCYDCQNCFGCVGLRSKKYCILNKQYSKEEYFEMLPKIRKHMEDMPYVNERGQVFKYGEYPPIEHAPFAFNESWISDAFPLSKEEALGSGYPWRDKEKQDYGVTLDSEDLPDHIKDVDDSICKEIIGCSHKGDCEHDCTRAFRLLPEELSLYRDYDLALPRECQTCRFREKIDDYMNPYYLWKRKCMCQSGEAKDKGHEFKNEMEHFHGDEPCPNEFETPYAPERKDLIYCEQCYQSELIS